MRNIFITGSSGYLGTRLMAELAAEKGVASLVGADIVAPWKANEKIVFLNMDIRNPRLDRLLARHRIDTLIHLAFVVQPIHDRQRMQDIDYNGTRNVLQSAYAAGVSHLIAVSSTLAYGAHPDNPPELDEDAPLRGNRSFPYGYHKARVDEMIQAFAASHPEMAVTILRPCTVFGPAVDNYVSRMFLRPFSASVRGNDPLVQFVHENDFVRACRKAVEKKIPGAFNIVGKGALRVTEAAALAGTRLLPLPAFLLYPLVEALWRLRFPGIEVNGGYLDYVRYPFVACAKKAASELGFAAAFSSRQVLAENVAPLAKGRRE